jgi:GntR family transcriptional regulator/MocR family aminotransferase
VDFSEKLVIKLEEVHKVKVYPVELHTIIKGMHKNKLIIGYGNLTLEEIKEGIHRLKQALQKENSS